MEDGHPAAPSHNPVPDHHPSHEPTAVVGDEEQHHEKKSFMTRIQNKVNKLKHNYHKKRHAHDQVSEVPVEEQSEEFDDTNEDMDVDSIGSSNLSVYEFMATSREFDCEHGPLVTPETVEPHILDDRDEPPVTLETDKPHILRLRGQDEPPVTFQTDKPHVPGGRDTIETDKPYVLGGRDELETDKSYILGDRDELETDKPYILGGRDEPPVTFQIDKPHLPDGRDTLETDKPYVLGGRDELETHKSYILGGRDELETHKPYILGGRDEPPVMLETDKPHFLGGRDEPPVTLETDKPHFLGGRDEPPVTPKTIKATTVEEETIAPLPYGSLPCTTDADADANLPTSVGLTPGNESSVLPEVLSSKSEQWRYQQPSEAQPGPEDETLVNHMLSDMEKKPSYTEKLSTTAAADEAAVSAGSTEYSAGTVSGPTGTPPPSYSEKLSSTAFAAKDAAVSAASMVYGKVGGKEEGTHSRETGGEVVTPVSNVSGTEEVAGEKKESYADRLSGSAYAAKDAAVMAASTMYGMMMGAGAAMMGNVVETEKLQPGEEDKAASEVVPESMQKVGEEDEVVKGRIELPEVTSREVVLDAPAVDKKSGGYTGQGMVEMITGAVTSFVGGRGGAADAPAAAVEAPSGGTADAPTAASGGGGTGGVAVAPAVAVEAPSGGAGKERVSEGLGY